MLLKNKIYDALKWIAIILIPALITFLTVVLKVINIDPETIRIVTIIISASGSFLGTVLGISTAQYTAQAGKEKKEAGIWIENKS